MRFDRGAFFRQVRAFHGYLSAASFIVLMIFSATGFLLNHPHWVSEKKPAADQTINLAPAELADAKAGNDPARALAGLIASKVSHRGTFKSGEIIDDEAQLRFEGVSGTTDVTVDLGTGRVVATTSPATVLQILDDLHRGKNAGPVWAAVIDVSAVLIFAMSALGYLIFLSLRFRMRTAFVLTGVSVAVLIGVYAAFVP